MRQLNIHISALNDAEYDLFTTSLSDLTFVDSDDPRRARSNDAFYEQMSVGAREARAWLQGRYPNVPAQDINSILGLFYPNLRSTDTLSAGQFFAVLRLILHVEGGKDVDRALAFVQVHPKSGVPSSNKQQPDPPRTTTRQLRNPGPPMATTPEVHLVKRKRVEASEKVDDNRRADQQLDKRRNFDRDGRNGGTVPQRGSIAEHPEKWDDVPVQYSRACERCEKGGVPCERRIAHVAAPCRRCSKLKMRCSNINVPGVAGSVRSPHRPQGQHVQASNSRKRKPATTPTSSSLLKQPGPPNAACELWDRQANSAAGAKVHRKDAKGRKGKRKVVEIDSNSEGGGVEEVVASDQGADNSPYGDIWAALRSQAHISSQQPVSIETKTALMTLVQSLADA